MQTTRNFSTKSAKQICSLIPSCGVFSSSYYFIFYFSLWSSYAHLTWQEIKRKSCVVLTIWEVDHWLRKYWGKWMLIQGWCIFFICFPTTHVLICSEDKNEKKDDYSSCQTKGKKIIQFHGKMSDNPSKKPTLLPLADRQVLWAFSHPLALN